MAKRLFLMLVTGALTLQNWLLADTWEECKSKTTAAMVTWEGWCTPEKATRMMELIKEVKPETCVEVGVFGGRSVFPMAAALEFNKKGCIYAIDPWMNNPCLEGLDGENLSWWSQVDLRKIMLGFMDGMNKNRLDQRYALMRMTSHQALPFFKDESIDILHIDGNHADTSSYFDATNWLPKVKKGGYIWFDDANWPETQRAVRYLLENCDLEPGYSLNDPYILVRKRL